MIKLPTYIPNPSQDYSLSIENNAIRTQMDSGRIRQRRRMLNSNNQIKVSWLFTDEEFRLFESFVFHALSGGADWFLCDVLTGGGITEHQVRFAGANYSASYKSHMMWKVSATLDVRQINRLPIENIVSTVYPIEKMQSLLYKIVNVQLPKEIGTIK